jgi:hypothetical protein
MSVTVSHNTASNAMAPFFGNMQMTPRVKYIASVHFENLTHEIAMAKYSLPAPTKKGEVTVLTVHDTIVPVKQSMSPEDEPVPLPAPAPVEVIVKSLLKEWTEGFIGSAGNYRPGIMEITGPEPTDDELKQLMEMENRHCHAWVTEADRISITGKGRIGSKHTLAAKWLGLHLSGIQRPWLHGQGNEDFKIGAASGKQIPMKAIMDDGTNLMKFYVENEINPLDYGDTFIASKLAAKGEADKVGLVIPPEVIPEDPSLDNELEGITFIKDKKK